MRTVYLNYKSGKTTTLYTRLTHEDIAKRIKNNQIDINPDDLTMIRWSEVESITKDVEIK